MSLLFSLVCFHADFFYCFFSCFFFFNDTATSEIYTRSLLYALPIYGVCVCMSVSASVSVSACVVCVGERESVGRRKSTRLNSSDISCSNGISCVRKKVTSRPRMRSSA